MSKNKNKNKRLTTGQRWLRYSLFMVASGLLGLATGFFSEYFSVKEAAKLVSSETFLWLSRPLLVMSMVIGLYFIFKADQTHQRYESSEDADDEVIDRLYSTTFRMMEYGVIAFNVASAFALANMVLAYTFTVVSDSATLSFPIVDLVLLLIYVVLQVIVLKTVQKIRQYKLSAFPTIKEMKDYVYSYDEGERQANFEQSFVTIFNLNQRVLPALYVLILVINFISQTKQTLALLIVAGIHIYINLSQYQAVRKYFK